MRHDSPITNSPNGRATSHAAKQIEHIPETVRALAYSPRRFVYAVLTAVETNATTTSAKRCISDPPDPVFTMGVERQQ